jgi:hypothetical protein
MRPSTWSARLHSTHHEQAGNAEIEEVEDADAQSQRHGHHRVNRSEHDGVDDLLGKHGYVLHVESLRDTGCARAIRQIHAPMASKLVTIVKFHKHFF